MIERDTVLSFEDGDSCKVEEGDALEPAMSVLDNSSDVKKWEGIRPVDGWWKEIRGIGVGGDEEVGSMGQMYKDEDERKILVPRVPSHGGTNHCMPDGEDGVSWMKKAGKCEARWPCKGRERMWRSGKQLGKARVVRRRRSAGL